MDRESLHWSIKERNGKHCSGYQLNGTLTANFGYLISLTKTASYVFFNWEVDPKTLTFEKSAWRSIRSTPFYMPQGLIKTKKWLLPYCPGGGLWFDQVQPRVTSVTHLMTGVHPGQSKFTPFHWGLPQAVIDLNSSPGGIREWIEHLCIWSKPPGLLNSPKICLGAPWCTEDASWSTGAGI